MSSAPVCVRFVEQVKHLWRVVDTTAGLVAPWANNCHALRLKCQISLDDSDASPRAPDTSG